MNIFVSMRLASATEYDEPRDALSHDWIKIFDAHNLTPILIPNASSNPIMMMESLPGKGLLLTGGDSLGGAEPSVRDRTELALISEAVNRRLPILGVCRGLQIINQYFGGTITYLDDRSHVGSEHEVEVSSSRCGLLKGQRFKVNSFHNEIVRATNLAPPLRSLAKAEDHVIEGLYHPELPITAIQWHPERSHLSTNIDNVLFNYWIDQCV